MILDLEVALHTILGKFMHKTIGVEATNFFSQYIKESFKHKIQV